MFGNALATPPDQTGEIDDKVFAERLNQALKALDHALDMHEELATHPQRPIPFAARARLQSLKQPRIYPNDGRQELYPGTALFLLARPQAAPRP